MLSGVILIIRFFLKIINVIDLSEINRRNLLMSKPCHETLMTIITHSLSTD